MPRTPHARTLVFSLPVSALRSRWKTRLCFLLFQLWCSATLLQSLLPSLPEKKIGVDIKYESLLEEKNPSRDIDQLLKHWRPSLQEFSCLFSGQSFFSRAFIFEGYRSSDIEPLSKLFPGATHNRDNEVSPNRNLTCVYSCCRSCKTGCHEWAALTQKLKNCEGCCCCWTRFRFILNIWNENKQKRFLSSKKTLFCFLSRKKKAAVKRVDPIACSEDEWPTGFE